MTNQINLTEGKSSGSTWWFILVVFLLLAGVNSYLSRATILELSDLQSEIRKSTKIVNLLQQLHVQVLTVESGQRGFLLTEDSPYLQHYNKSITNIDQVTKQLIALESSDDSQKALIKELIELVNLKLAEMQRAVRKAKQQDLSQAIEIVESDKGLQLYREVHAIIQRLKAKEQQISERQILELEMVSNDSERNLVISLFTTLILVFGLFLLVRVNLKNQHLRQQEIESQNKRLHAAVEERTQELSLYSEELSRSNRELEDFAFVASHDLQEPLRKIMAFGDRLESQSDALSEKQVDYLKRMRSAAARMSKLISDLLEFSRVNTKGKDFQTVDLQLVVNDCLDDLNVLIEESGVELSIDSLPSISADPTQMQQLFFNLLANAIKFSQHNQQALVGLSVTKVEQPAEVDIDGLSDWLQFRISDNGIGFDPEHAEKIFAPFQRLHSRTEFKGTGIGLAICRRIVERHNGYIHASAKPGEGAVITVVLPAINFLNSVKRT
ncbi:CHASE3 domain-containing protein [Glaciecola sp. MH2013]|uniref:sensor histidine kinase n=1 Tax=Glaciecola sp. MH2013 TaxID=2785524 RepID=UPI00189D3716|nr:sensor histidine kinase [Glaciecola sp. MH2013]MBF7073420.1 CHASE3 domain-containing protein [Glaciecola sp. MH2013]